MFGNFHISNISITGTALRSVTCFECQFYQWWHIWLVWNCLCTRNVWRWTIRYSVLKKMQVCTCSLYRVCVCFFILYCNISSKLKTWAVQYTCTVLVQPKFLGFFLLCDYGSISCIVHANCSSMFFWAVPVLDYLIITEIKLKVKQHTTLKRLYA